ncbi:MAG: response regulator [Planctomycetes bacterium]|nr:response regulator [Planctomycetota bacterium]
MSTFHIFAVATYWLLIVLWTFILAFYLIRLRRQRLKNALFVTLIVVLAIDAFRTLFESLYFGIWYTALAGLLPERIQDFLEHPGVVLIPKLLNVLTAAIIILILLRRWIPVEEAELQSQQNRELDLQAEVAARTKAVEETNERLRKEIVEHSQAKDALRHAQKMEAVGRLAGGVSHDFNNRLMTILGNTELILGALDKHGDQVDREQLRSCVQEIRQAGERGADLVRQLLTFSRKQLIKSATLDTRRILTQTKTMLTRLIPENIKFEMQIAPDVASIAGVDSQVEQIVMNLVLNARDSIVHTGHVSVVCKNADISKAEAAVHPGTRPGPHVMISVQDDGIGMTEDLVLHIFEPFFTTKPVGKGTGLGLASVDGMVSQMNGFVTVESEQGVGTTFRVFVPAVEDEPDETSELDPGTCSGHGETVLVCEDEPSVRKVTSQILRNAGYLVLEAKDGNQALEMVRAARQPIDVLVTDLVMPGMNGQELSEQARSASPHLQTVFVSGYASTAVNFNLSNKQKQAFLRKPFESVDLLRIVRTAVDAINPDQRV